MGAARPKRSDGREEGEERGDFSLQDGGEGKSVIDARVRVFWGEQIDTGWMVDETTTMMITTQARHRDGCGVLPGDFDVSRACLGGHHASNKQVHQPCTSGKIAIKYPLLRCTNYSIKASFLLHLGWLRLRNRAFFSEYSYHLHLFLRQADKHATAKVFKSFFKNHVAEVSIFFGILQHRQA